METSKEEVKRNTATMVVIITPDDPGTMGPKRAQTQPAQKPPEPLFSFVGPILPPWRLAFPSIWPPAEATVDMLAVWDLSLWRRECSPRHGSDWPHNGGDQNPGRSRLRASRAIQVISRDSLIGGRYHDANQRVHNDCDASQTVSGAAGDGQFRPGEIWQLGYCAVLSVRPVCVESKRSHASSGWQTRYHGCRAGERTTPIAPCPPASRRWRQTETLGYAPRSIEQSKPQSAFRSWRGPGLALLRCRRVQQPHQLPAMGMTG